MSHFNPNKFIPCRYFLQGQCKLGSKCEYSHTTDKPVHILKDGPPICAFYLKGDCRYGNDCKFRHLTKKQLKQSEEQNLQSSSQLPPRRKILNKNQNVTQLSNSSKLSKIEFSVPPSSFANAVNRNNPNNKEQSKNAQDTNLNFKAEEFVPSWKKSNNIINNSSSIDNFCPTHVETGKCELYDQKCCPFKIHGSQCPICTLYLINDDKEAKCQHFKNCSQENEEEILENCKIQDSEKQVCKICLDIVWEKPNSSERRFGVLENCDHIFCLACIREWRKTKISDRSAVRGCPECRQESNFIIPSNYVVKGQDKTKLITDYKKALSSRHCMHFKRGKASCPFGTSCFYKHEYEDGTLQDRTDDGWKSKRWDINGERIFANRDGILDEIIRDHIEFMNEEFPLDLDNEELLADLMAQLDFEIEMDNFTAETASDYEDYEDDQIWDHGEDWVRFL